MSKHGHISRKFKRRVTHRTWHTERRVVKTVRFSRTVRKYTVEKVTPLLVLSCGHAIKSKTYDGKFPQSFAYCKECYEKHMYAGMSTDDIRRVRRFS